jgi:hypothetical protein
MLYTRQWKLLLGYQKIKVSLLTVRFIKFQNTDIVDIVICLSGRGDKDVVSVAEALPKFGPQIGWYAQCNLDNTDLY